MFLYVQNLSMDMYIIKKMEINFIEIKTTVVEIKNKN